MKKKGFAVLTGLYLLSSSVSAQPQDGWMMEKKTSTPQETRREKPPSQESGESPKKEPEPIQAPTDSPPAPVADPPEEKKLESKAEDEDDIPVFELDPVVVTAEKEERPQSRTPTSTIVLNEKEIERINPRNYDDVLRLQPGINVIRPQGNALVIPQQLQIRGVQGPDRVLILVDGVPVNNGANDFINLNTLPSDAIERIEVLKGGGSALYGTNALGGVVNIITKAGAGLEPGEVEVTTSAQAGNFSSYNTRLGIEGAGEKIGFAFNYEHDYTANYLFRETMLDSLAVGDQVEGENILGQTGTGRGDIKLVERPAANLDYISDRYYLKVSAEPAEGHELDFVAGYATNRSGVKDARNINVLTPFPTVPAGMGPPGGGMGMPPGGGMGMPPGGGVGPPGGGMGMPPGGGMGPPGGMGMPPGGGMGPPGGGRPAIAFPDPTILDSFNLSEQYNLGLNYGLTLNEDWKLNARLARTGLLTRFVDESFDGVNTLQIPFPPPDGTRIDIPRFAPSERRTSSSVDNLELRVNGKLSESNNLVAGVEYKGKNATWSSINIDTGNPIKDPVRSASDSIIGVYLQDTMTFAENTDVVLGLRLDSHSEFGEALSPKVGLLHRFNDKSRFRANYSRSFKAPALNQLFEPDFVFAPFNVFRSNPNLEAETIDTFDIGIEGEFFDDRLALGATYFYNKLNNQIITRNVGTELQNGVPIGIRRYENLASSVADGLELSARAELTDGLGLRASYTYLDLRAGADGPVNPTTGLPDPIDGTRLDQAPEHFGALTLFYDNKKKGSGHFQGAVTARGQSATTDQSLALRQQIDLSGFVVFDLNLDYKFTDNGQAFLTWYNVGDKKYQVTGNDFAQGSQVFGGIRLTW